MDKKQKSVIFTTIVLGFLLLMVGTVLLVIGSLTLEDIYVYISFGCIGAGFLGYVAVIILALIYIKRKNR